MTTTEQDNSPAFPTSEQGFKDTVSWLKSNTGPGDVVLARKDLTVYLPAERGVPIDPHFASSARGAEVPLSKRPVASAFQKIWPFEIKDSTFYTGFELAYVNDKAGFADWMVNKVNMVADSKMDSFLKSAHAQLLIKTYYQKVVEFGDYVVYRRIEVK